MASAEGFLRCVYEGCISGCDSCVERRPYHKNCRCALHKPKKGCPHGLPRSNNVSYPVRRSWSDGSLLLMASQGNANASLSPSSSPARPPAWEIERK
ncbi:hypothetical protein MLD38_006678 [Melastoma candidum]|uniref:Uncharacterized protein n=1 Tax=Melastoma candidum TaxID=119954 RepID=A0ACB9RSF3_9MYRT|nr:hypothetical protein MLD38_006678 [Melastoma candidum]